MFSVTKKLWVSAAIFIMLFNLSSGVELVLKDGTKLSGEIVEQNDAQITIRTENMDVTVPRSRIKSGLEGSSSAPQTNASEQIKKAEALFKDGKFVESEKIYKEIIAKDPLNNDAHTKLKILQDYTKLPGTQKDAANQAAATPKPAKDITLSDIVSSQTPTPLPAVQNDQNAAVPPFQQANQGASLFTNAQAQPDAAQNAAKSPFTSATDTAGQTSSQTSLPPFQQPDQNTVNSTAAQYQSGTASASKSDQSLPPFQQPDQPAAKSPFAPESNNANQSAGVPFEGDGQISKGKSPFDIQPAQNSQAAQQPVQQSAGTNSASPFSPPSDKPNPQPQITNAAPGNTEPNSPFNINQPANNSPFAPPQAGTNSGTQNTQTAGSNEPPLPSLNSVNSNPVVPANTQQAKVSSPETSPFGNLPSEGTNPQIAKSDSSLPSLNSVNANPVVPANTQNNANLQMSQVFKKADAVQPQMQTAQVQPATVSKSSSKGDSPTIAFTGGIDTNRENYAKSPAGYDINSPEFRGVWITRFEWVGKTSAEMQASIVKIMEAAEKANMNAAVFQVRGEADTLYKSSFEPWAPMIGGKDPGFDPLEFAIQEAHKRGLEFHAYINLMPIWSGATPPPHSTPEHAYWQHCVENSNPNWAMADDSGKYMTPGKEYDGYVYGNPAAPELQVYLRQVVVDVVQRYDVDGIHFDRIRYPGKGFSGDPISKQRFASANPDNLSRDDWQRDQITKMLNDIYGACYAIKPKVKFSAAVWGIYDKTKLPGYDGFSSGYHDYYQDSVGWLKKGAMDALCPMIYWDSRPVTQKLNGKKAPCFLELAKFFHDNSGDRHSYMGTNSSKEGQEFQGEEIEKEINFTRTIGAKGMVFFSYSGTEKKGIFDYLKGAAYPSKVKTPDMPWKSNPTTGVIVGYVKDASGKPVVDAKINIDGKTENWLSSGDGFFAILSQNPGKVKITASRNGGGSASVENVEVVAGKATQIEIKLQ